MDQTRHQVKCFVGAKDTLSPGAKQWRQQTSVSPCAEYYMYRWHLSRRDFRTRIRKRIKSYCRRHGRVQERHIDPSYPLEAGRKESNPGRKELKTHNRFEQNNRASLCDHCERETQRILTNSVLSEQSKTTLTGKYRFTPCGSPWVKERQHVLPLKRCPTETYLAILCVIFGQLEPHR